MIVLLQVHACALELVVPGLLLVRFLAFKLLLFLLRLLCFDLYRVDKLKPTLSCPTKTIKCFTKLFALIINPLLVVLKEVLVDWFFTVGFPTWFQVRRIYRNVLGPWC